MNKSYNSTLRQRTMLARSRLSPRLAIIRILKARVSAAVRTVTEDESSSSSEDKEVESHPWPIIDVGTFNR